MKFLTTRLTLFSLLIALVQPHGLRPRAGSARSLLTLDVVSVGSTTRPHYLQGQVQTWASPEHVRTYHAVTELDDANPVCASDMGSVREYTNSCRQNPNFSEDARRFVDKNFGFTEGSDYQDSIERLLPGWFCAQRRTMQGVLGYINKLDLEDIPDYLIIVDDDTYFDTHGFHQHLQGTDPNDSRAYAGCLFEKNSEEGIMWEFPYGGFGFVLSKGAIRQMMTPLHCDGSNDSTFENKPCQALEDNRINEKPFFKEGMTIVELMSNYSAFSEPLCFHSDWIMGYMVDFYLPVIRHTSTESNATIIHPILTWPFQCGNHTLAPTCDPMSGENGFMFCHRQEPEHLSAYQTRAEKLYPSLSKRNATAMKKAVENFERIVPPFASKEAKKISRYGSKDASSWLESLKQDTVVVEPRTKNSTFYWEAARKWFTPRQVFPETQQSEHLSHVMDLLATGRILKASSITSVGSQLKLLLELEGGQKAIFKPERDSSSWDQPNSEIASFHLSRLLDFRRTPITVGRFLNVAQEILQVADQELAETFMSTEGFHNCFYGTCKYCSTQAPVCPDYQGYVEGVMILLLPEELDGSETMIGKMDNPFPVKGDEEMMSKDYCDSVVKKEVPLAPRLLDLVETSIVDFLIQNIDRHSYEFIADRKGDGAIMLIDQGKAFQRGKSGYDEMRLLAPLAQCCVLRDTTFEQLRWISRWDVPISEALDDLLSVDVSFPILIGDDLAALDRRMEIVQHTISACISERGAADVLQGYATA